MRSKGDDLRSIACVEALEGRRLLSASAFPNVNISKAAGNQPETAIAIDPTNSARLFAVSNTDNTGLYAARSSDGGATWTGGTIASGASSTDTLPTACCDPSAAFDAYGNLFLTYLDTNDNVVVIALSKDGGQTFSVLQRFMGDVDQPTVTTGPGGTWVSFERNGQIVAAGASVSGPGQVGIFSLEKVPGSGGGHYADIAVGPSGQVMVTWQRGSDANGSIFVSTDADGLGASGFSRKPVLATRTRVGNFDYIPPQDTRGSDAEMGLAWDRSGGPFTGRIYLVYTDELPPHSGNTDVLLRYSDNGGLTWSAPARVNDDTGVNAQFFPRIALDQTSGQVGVSWYDARNDLGQGTSNDTDGKPNTDVAVYAALVTPTATGLNISSSARVSEGVSNSAASDMSDPDETNAIGFGDYEGLVFHAGVMHPVWADNSNSTQDNPDGALNNLDVYTATVSAAALGAPASTWLGGLAGPGPVGTLATPGALVGGYVRGGSSYTFQMLFNAAVNPATLTSGALLVTRPDGSQLSLTLVRLKYARRQQNWTATFKVPAVGGHWTAAQDGTYLIAEQAMRISDSTGAFAPAGDVGYFVVLR